MKKIYPFNSSAGTYKNYNQYLIWLKCEQESLTEYLNFFSPRYEILNEKMEYITSDGKATSSTPITNVFKIIKVNNEDKYCLFPSKLNYRQGYLNTQSEAYACFDKDAFEKLSDNETTTLSEAEWKQFIDEGKIKQIPPSYTIFSTKWRRGIQTEEHIDGFYINNYILFSKATSSWYLLNSVKGKIIATFIPDALNNAGSIVTFSLELEPSRYYIVNNTDAKWKRGSLIWRQQAAYWSNTGDTEPDPLIARRGSSNDIVCGGNYPLMHQLVLHQDNKYEEFIVDNYLEEELRNIVNHPTMVYSIHTQNIKQQEITNMWENIEVLIC